MSGSGQAMEKEVEALDSSKEDKADLDSTLDAESSEDKVATETVTPLTPPPMQDGGTRAWLQVVGGFLVFANLWGVTFAWGSFQSYYEITLLPSLSASTISWIGTVTVFLLVFVGVLSGPLFDSGHFKAMLLVGATLETLSLFLMSISHQYWSLMLTQGVLQGLANGLLYIPGLALVSRSFHRHRAIALGLTTCGAPVGGIVYTLIFERLISHMSFGWTVRIQAFVMLGSYLISFPLLLWGAKNMGDLASGTKRKLFDKGALKDPPFYAYSTAVFLIFLGYMIPFNFIPSYGQLVLGLSRSTSLYIAMIAQATSVVGRLIAGYSASKIGAFIPWIICVASSGVLCLGWIGAHSQSSLITFAALYGAFSGALIPLPPSAFTAVCPDPKVYGTRFGMAQALNSFGSLTGSPIGGALAAVSSSSTMTNYLGLQLFAGLIMLAGACNLLLLWFLLSRRRDGGGILV